MLSYLLYCVMFIGDLNEAKVNFDLALELNPVYEKAKSWQRKVRLLLIVI